MLLQRYVGGTARGNSLILCPSPVRTIRFAYRAQLAVQRRTFIRYRDSCRDGRAAYDTLNVEQIARERSEYERRRLVFLASGSAAGLIAMGCTAWQLKKALEQQPTKLDTTAPSSHPPTDSPSSRKVVIHGKDGRELVPTGNSTVPDFPRTLNLPLQVIDNPPSTTLPQEARPSTEYTLVGLGTRTVSFLGIQVYVLGFYIATADIAALQNSLVKRVNPIATTLVSGEKDGLRADLLDADRSERIWNDLLQRGALARSLFRIVPVRDTDFHHLRDGLVRAIQAQAPKILKPHQNPAQGELSDSSQDFGNSMRQFRQIFNRGKVPRQKELLMIRGADGTLSVVYDDGLSSGPQQLGSVSDERLSRALWLNYLGGRKVASEPARRSIVDGVIEFVERPVGTVATQVV